MSTSFNVLIVGIVALLVGIAFCFAGYRFFRFLIAIGLIDTIQCFIDHLLNFFAIDQKNLIIPGNNYKTKKLAD